MRDRAVTITPIVAVAGVFGLCCGLPVLLSLGVLSAAAGLSRQSWALIGLGLVLAILGWVRRAHRGRRRGSISPSYDIGGSRAPQDRTPDQTRNSAKKGDHP